MIPSQKKNDATFLRTCVEFLYKENLDVLKNKCIRTTPLKDTYSGLTKMPISPDKLNAINVEYRNRIYRQQKHLNAGEFSDRLSKKAIIQSLSRGIYNINKKNSNRCDNSHNSAHTLVSVNTSENENIEEFEQIEEFEEYEVLDVSEN